MKRLLTTIFAGGMMASAALATPTQTYINPANVLVSQQVTIDAVNFINYGSWDIGVYPYNPFETFDTLNYTNYGSMISIPGWRFGLNSTFTGLRSPAANFVNFNPGQITGLDFDNVANSVIGNPCVIARVDPSYLLVFATNIVGRAGALGFGASLVSGPNGEIRLQGQNVDLTRSGLEVVPIWAESITLGTGNIFVGNPPTAFIPDIAVFDQEWVSGAYSQMFPLGTAGLWDGLTATAPTVPVNQGAAPGVFQGFSFPVLGASTADSFVSSSFQVVMLTNFVFMTNTITDTNCMPPVDVEVVDQVPVVIPVTVRSNVVKGAVIVGVPPEFSVPQIGFTPTPVANNPAAGFPAYQESSVLISVGISNAVTGLIEPALIRIDDTLASQPTLRGVIPNQVGCGAVTSRPLNYAVDRQNQLTGTPGNNGYPDPDFFRSSDSGPFGGPYVIGDLVTNDTVIAGNFAAYTNYFDNIVTRPPSVPGALVSNTPGRIVISANALDLTRTRFRGEGGVFISTPQLISSSQALVDVENISYDLGSTNGTLQVQNLVPPSGLVQRMRGPVSMWSAIWQNTAVVNLGPNYIFTNVPVMSSCTNVVIGTNTLVLMETNVLVSVSVYYQALMVDATRLTTELPVNVHELTMHSPNVVLNDHMTVLQSLLIDGRSFTLNGGITIPGAFPPDPITGLTPAVLPLFDWTAKNAPSLLYFTNNGTLSVFNEAHFGDDRPSPYTVFRNQGTLLASSVNVDSFNFENGGTISSSFGLVLQGSSGKMAGGSSFSGGETAFFANTLKFDQYQMTAGGALNFTVSNALADAGSGSANQFQSQNGINLRVKPKTGDLLGTTLHSVAPSVPSIQLDHAWAAEDRGPTPAGYSNNVAVGRLQLTSLSPDPLFHFRGTSAHNAMYVDLLDLSALTDYENQIAIDNNLVIYYAALLPPISVTIPPNTNGIAQEPEEFFDGQFGGHLRWVQSFGGPNSSAITTMVFGGQTNSISVNRALLNSKIIDSNGNSIPNFYDTSPDGVFAGGVVAVNVVGNGSVLNNYNGQVLLTNQPYTMVAVPADGNVFSGWTGSIVTNTPTLTFLASNGMTFTATFSFVLSPGSYRGLFYEDLPAGIELQRSGAITVKTANGGKCSGSVEILRNRYSFTTQLDANGAATVLIPKAGLILNLVVGDDHITGTIGDGATWAADIHADRAVFDARSNPAPQAGTYTMIIPGSGDPNNAQLPFGDSYFTLKVDPSGKVSMKGTLSDNTRVTESSIVSADGQTPLYIPLYSGGGQILGWITFEDTGGQDVGGTVSWIKQPNVKAKLYPNGFDIEPEAMGSAYDSLLSPVTGFSDGETALKGGNLSTGITNLISIGADNKVTNLSTNKMTLRITPKSGLFKGSVLGPAGKKINFNGVIFQKLNFASGFFAGTNQSGIVIISPE